jgi:hypothetical protein
MNNNCKSGAKVTAEVVGSTPRPFLVLYNYGIILSSLSVVVGQIQQQRSFTNFK